MKRPNKENSWFELYWQRPFSLEDIYALLDLLGETEPRGFITLEARGSGRNVRFLLGTLDKYVGKVRTVLKSRGHIELNPIEGNRQSVQMARVLSVNKPVLSLSTDKTAEVIRGALNVLASTPAKSEAVVQIIIGKSASPSAQTGKIQDPHQSLLDLALFGIREASSDSIHSAKEKSDQLRYNVVIRIGAAGKNVEGRVDNLASAFRVLQSPGVRLKDKQDKPNNLDACYFSVIKSQWLSIKEIAAFLLWPAGEDDLPGVPGLHPKRLLPPTRYKEPVSGNQDRSFAKSLNCIPKKISISPADSLEHTIILGPTGSGKSTVMENLILADVRAGRSVLVLDPKADLVAEVLRRIPENRIQDVVVIDPSSKTPVGFNPLHLQNYKGDDRVADAVLTVFKEIFADSWGVRTQQYLQAALKTLVAVPDSNLLWIPELLNNDAFRKKVLSLGKRDRYLSQFWHWYSNTKEAERNTYIMPVLTKMQQFTLQEGIRNVIGQSNPKFDLSELFTGRKIVLIPLNTGQIGRESARLLGSLVVGLTWTLALSRADVAPEKRHLVSVYIDELQDYLSLPTDLSDALAQARGLGVGITMAHQYRSQLSPDIKAAVDANARNKIIFGLNGNDAKEMSHHAPELKPEDFMLLPRYSIYTNIMQNKKSTGWMMAQTFPTGAPIREARIVKAASEKMYGIPKKIVEDEFFNFLNAVKREAAAEDKSESQKMNKSNEVGVERNAK